MSSKDTPKYLKLVEIFIKSCFIHFEYLRIKTSYEMHQKVSYKREMIIINKNIKFFK